MNGKDRQIVRELAKRYMELTCSERQRKMVKRMRDNNDLVPGRPPVLIDEIPWYQMDIDGELMLRCEDPRVRGVEDHFRKALFYFKHFPGIDNLYEPFLRVQQALSVTEKGIGLPSYNIRRTDGQNNIISRELEDQLEDESVLEKFKLPEMTPHPEIDADNIEFLTDLLGDVMPLRFFGYGPYYLNAWDYIAYVRGVEAIYIDLYDRPEYLLAIVQKLVDYANKYLDYIEANLKPDKDVAWLHCTPGYISGMEDGLKGVWFRDNAQPLGSISPAMFGEFAIDPVIELSKRFKYTYYGCCEPLDDKIEQVKKIPNLRKVGCPPWASVEATAEQLGGNYVLSRKPNPAKVAISTDPEEIRRETEETVKACLKHGCPYELVLKDISTVNGWPGNLIVWAETVSGVLNGYYD
jgi:hypothetical protein